MTEYNNAREQAILRWEKYINNVVALIMMIDCRPRELCQCLKLYNLRGRFIHERKCVVGLCMEAWKKAEELLNLASSVFVEQKGGLYWKLKVQPKIEDAEEKELILGRVEDFYRAMRRFCDASQVFYKEDRYPFYSPTEDHIDELLLLDFIPMEFYRCLAWDRFFCEDMLEEMRQEN